MGHDLKLSGLSLDRLVPVLSRNGAWPHLLLLKLEAVGKFNQENVMGMDTE